MSIGKNYIKKCLLGGLLFAGLCGILGLSGCGKNSVNGPEAETANTKKETASEDKISIGMSFDSFVIERWIRDRDVFVARAQELGAEVNFQSANGDVKEQISQIEYLMEKDVDVLCVVAADCSALSDVLQEAKKRGIKVISYDRLILNADSDLYISFDNEMVGTLMAKALKEEIPEGGKIFMIQGSEDDNNVKLVREGFLQELEGSSLEVVYMENCQDWLAENAIAFVNEALEQYPDVAGIMCGNDDIATQVVRVLSEERLAGKVKVVGQDGDLAACQRIVEGTQNMTAFKSVDALAKFAAECAVSLAKGEELEDTGVVMNDGMYEIPCSFLDPVAVTDENMEEVIVDGGFHSREDVYLNVKESD